MSAPLTRLIAFRGHMLVAAWILAATAAAASQPPAIVPDADESTRDAPTREALTRAIEELGAPDFATRQLATEFLWQAGPPAMPYLERALLSSDRETVFRARSILDKFRYGIFPDTPPYLVALIEQFRSGGRSQQFEVLRRLLDADEIGIALTLVNNEQDENHRQELTRWLLRDAERIVAHLLRVGRDDEARTLLELDQQTAQGLTDLTVFYLLEGDVESRLSALQQELRRNESPATRQRLAWLLRGVGRTAEAVEAAAPLRNARDSTWETMLFADRRWEALAQAQREQFRDDPTVHENAQFLGYAAAFQVLAGEPQHAVGFLDALAARGRDHSEEAWICARSLLLLNQPETAYEILSHQTQPGVRFRLLARQGRYFQAFHEVGIDDPTADLTDWFDTLADDARATESAERRNRFYIGMEVCRALHRLGEVEEARKYLALLAEVAKDDEDGRHRRLREVCDLEFELGEVDAAFEHGIYALDGELASTVLQILFPTRTSEALTWWNIYRQERADESRTETLLQIRGLFDEGEDGWPAEKVLEEVRWAEGIAERADERNRYAWITSLSETCLLHGLDDEAERLLARAEPHHAAAARELGNRAYERQDWLAAADHFQRAFELDPKEAITLYMQGLCLTRLGQVEEGERAMRLAERLPLRARSRRSFALDLDDLGLSEEARRQWELIARTESMESYYFSNAHHHLGNMVEPDDRHTAADHWNVLRMSGLKMRAYFPEPDIYLHLPFLVHHARARGYLDEQQYDEAAAAGRRALRALPHAIELAEDLVPGLVQAGLTEEADSLFDPVYSSHHAICTEFPRSASYHNNLAWLLARTDRRLEEALELAERAVELEPGSTTYMDTLAEVHFRRGNLPEAIALARRCVELNGENEHYREQLARFLAEQP